jgi:hypothetical protein
MSFNPNCDGGKCDSSVGEVRVLPTGGDGNAILCRSCHRHELSWRRDRNRELGDFAKFDLPTWESLKVYDPGVSCATHFETTSTSFGKPDDQ